ncbi:MAG: HAMP domain-containing histidine kinase [Lachnospiraceae bacterium]
MRVFVNRNIRKLFVQMALCMAAVVLISVLPVAVRIGGPALWRDDLLTENMTIVSEKLALSVPLCAMLIGGAALFFCYRYFRHQDRQMEEAVVQIRAFISGDEDARIACDEEGELYRLFHEINSLAAILNAQVQKEGQSREFLKNTISDISHQLKTPLAALNIYNGIMQTEAETGGLATIREFAGLSEQELDRIETLVQNLLKITKFDAGTMVVEKRQENISEIMAEVEKHFAHRARQEEKQVVLSGSDAVSFSCDRSWILEALDNLVKNALDHTESGDSIWMTWEKSPSAVRMTVKDSGNGIHPEDLHHIFKRFYRSRYSQDTQGIGLGLPLVKAVAEAHGGSVSVDSRLGEGAAFVLLFPVAEKISEQDLLQNCNTGEVCR